MALEEKAKRARSDDQKAKRQAAILSAARELIDESGFDSVTMNALAKRAGLAKGTLYLYVRTKEELFLLLSVEAMEAFVDRFLHETKPGDNIAQIAHQMTVHAKTTPLFLPMFARLVAVIEANVADDPLFNAKRKMLALGAEYGGHLAKLLGVTPEDAAPVTQTLMMALQGAAQFDLSSRRDPDTLPDDLRAAFASNAFALNFEPSARMILSTVNA